MDWRRPAATRLNVPSLPGPRMRCVSTRGTAKGTCPRQRQDGWDCAPLPFVRQKFSGAAGFVSPVYFALVIRRELGSLRGLYSATTITSLRRSIERC